MDFDFKKLIPIGFKVASPIAPRLTARASIELFCRPQKTKRSPKEIEFWTSGKKVELTSKREARMWGEGPLVVLCHGWESRGSAFFKFVPALVSAGYQVLAWDGPAHGDSPGKRTHLQNYSKSLAKDLLEINIPVHGIVGHSFGGAAQGVLPRFYPHRIPKTVIIAAPASIENVFKNYFNLIQLPQKVREIAVDMIEREVGYKVSDISLINTNLPEKTDVLVMHDHDDKEVSPKTVIEVLQGKWPQAKFYFSKGLGHRRIVRDATIIETVIEFLKTTT